MGCTIDVEMHFSSDVYVDYAGACITTWGWLATVALGNGSAQMSTTNQTTNEVANVFFHSFYQVVRIPALISSCVAHL
jgi:hypothetical protein